MKKILEISTLKGIFAWFLVCVVFWIVVFADWNTLKSFRNTWWSDAPNMENKLSADTWNSVLAELDHLRDELSWALNSPNLILPKWAIVAFDSKTGCPNDGTREIFAQADGKSLMGVWLSSLSQVWNTGWSPTAFLMQKHIPPHSHLFKDTVFSENNKDNWNWQTIDGYWNNNGYLVVSSYEMPLQYMHKLEWSSDTDWDNDILYWMRYTKGSICPAYPSTTFISQTKFNRNDGCVASQESFSIQDPYVKVVYCKKK